MTRYRVVSRDEKAYQRRLILQAALFLVFVFFLVIAVSFVGIHVVPDAPAVPG